MQKTESQEHTFFKFHLQISQKTLSSLPLGGFDDSLITFKIRPLMGFKSRTVKSKAASGKDLFI